MRIYASILKQITRRFLVQQPQQQNPTRYKRKQ